MRPFGLDKPEMEPTFVRRVGEYAVRVCGIDDVQKVISINLSTLPEHYSDYFFEELLHEAPETFLVAEKDGFVLGYIMCRIELGMLNLRRFALGKKGHIVSVAILEPHRKNGLGTALIEEALKGMVKKGCSETFLEVRESNRPAITLYERLGFSITSRIESYYRDGETAFVMAKPIVKS
jgi:ribosomal-protein-alanine N-acetyltransferase